MKIGFLGFGNMAQAMAKGLLLTESVAPQDIYACAKDWEKLCRNTQPSGMVPCHSAEEMIEQVDLVVIAIKPYMIPKVVPALHDLLTDKIIISVAAGYTYDKFNELMGDDLHVLCTIPNTPISVGEGIIVCEQTHSLTADEFAAFEQLFSKSALIQPVERLCTIPNTPISVGEGIIVCEQTHSLTADEFAAFEQLFSKSALIQPVESHLLSVAGTVAGCSPAFISMFLEALGDAGVKHGLPRALAYRLAGQALCGTGKMHVETGAHPGAMKDAVLEALGDAGVKHGLPRALAYRLAGQALCGTGKMHVETGAHPGAMKDAVCSPGGTTIKGVSALEHHGFRSAVIDAIDAIEGK